MSSQKTSKAAPIAPTVQQIAEEEVRAQPIAFAYAMVPVPGKPGMYRDVLLRNVHAEEIEFLDTGARPSKPVYCLDRIRADIGRRNYKGGFG